MRERKTSRIYHIADTHFRNYKRHAEYRKVLDKLYDYLKKDVDENSLIFLGGDIVHSKTDMSPELVNIVTEFFNNLLEIGEVILICGNHDANLNNDNRLDALTPIVNAINNDKLHYWKDSGVYELHGIKYSVFSIFGVLDNWVLAKDIEGDYKIALHHGAVSGAKTDLDFEITNDYVNLSLFNGFDLGLLGDIHLANQTLQEYSKEKNQAAVKYPGSFIQQDLGEGIIHGILKWDLETRTSEFIRIHNDIAYATIEIKDGKVITPKEYFETLPKYLRFRVKYENTPYDKIQDIIDAIKTRHTLIETSLMRMDNSNSIDNPDKTVLGDVRDVEYQNKLLKEFLENNGYEVNIDRLRYINRVANSKLSKENVLVRNIIWEPKKFTFSNMFSYGENNSINFTNLKGTIGLFAPNASGKSTLLESFTFCIFDKCSKTFRASDVLNNRKDEFKCRLDFTINGIDYYIKRHGIKDKHGHVKVLVDFAKIENGVEVSLNGKSRSDTNQAIRNYLGTYEDFMLTTFSSQNDNDSFIFKSQKDRKDLLNSFLDLSIFGELHDIAREDARESKILLKSAITNINHERYDNLEEKIKTAENYLKECEKKSKDNDKEVTKLNKKIKELTSFIKHIDTTIDKNFVEENIRQLQENLELNKQLLKDNTKYLDEFTENINNFNIEIEEYRPKNDEFEKAEELKNIIYHEIEESLAKINKFKYKISDCKEKIKHLENHEYDPNCKYCIQNQFVKDAEKAKTELPKYELELIDLQKKLGDLNSKNDKIHYILEKRDKYNIIQNKIQKIDSQIKLFEHKISSNKNEISNINYNLLEANKQLKLYESHKKLYEENNKITEEINKLEEEYKVKRANQIKLDEEKLEANNKFISLNSLLTSWNEQKEEMKQLVIDANLYEAYIKALNNNGIPYTLLKKVLPVIQYEVNEILKQLVEFYIIFETDDKNIMCYIHYNDNHSWPVELASGMERFIISMAIRSALINISILPRPNFIAIDEGFGVLDSEMVNSLDKLFDYLEYQFDYILCISHLTEMKDLATSLLPINKNEEGYSIINNN